MFANEILPDLQAQLPNIEFGQQLEIHVEAPTDPATKPAIEIVVDGEQLPAGEISLPTL